MRAHRVDSLARPSAHLAGADWAAAPWSGRFVDMVSGQPGLYDTRAAVLWSAEGMSIGFRIEDPFPQATLRERDALVFRENDIEVFIDVGHSYYELELNALGTVYEVLHVWRDTYRTTPVAGDPAYDLTLPTSYTFGGDYDRRPESFWDGTHPRGVRYAFRNFDLPGLQTAVAVDGTLNDPGSVSRGWSAEIHIPWEGVAAFAGPTWHPPASGDTLRMFLGRFQQLHVGGQAITAAWCEHAHGIFDTHRPESFTVVEF